MGPSLIAVPCFSQWRRMHANFGSPAILGSFGRTSQRRRGPVALRHQLWLVLPFSLSERLSLQ